MIKKKKERKKKTRSVPDGAYSQQIGKAYLNQTVTMYKDYEYSRLMRERATD